MVKKLSELLLNINVISVVGNKSIAIKSLTLDSRGAKKGAMFFAVKGSSSDGHNYISSAIEQGASAIICTTLPETIVGGVTYVVVDDSNIAIGQISSAFYDNPSSKIKVIGITGTNGKTTTATLLYDLFSAMGCKCGLISTVVYYIGVRKVESTHTTPDAIRTNEMMAEMVNCNCSYCFMEVSSHSIVQSRIEGLTFAGGIFTNITHDHLDYHITFAEYIKAKKGFFDSLPKEAFALFNNDDRNGSVMVQNCKATKRSFSLRGISDYKCKIMESHFNGTLLRIDNSEVWVNLIGEFNGYNILGVYAAAIELGQDKQKVLAEISKLTSVAGRFEHITTEDGIVAIVDYAHTPDALKNVIETIVNIKPTTSKLITVIGCGGNRDKTKRPEMAEIAVSKSDFTILTSDNPRGEIPEEILNDMVEGVKNNPDLKGKYVVITDRCEAIKMATLYAKGGAKKGSKGDIILIAGKGHENYQEVCGVKHHHDDREEVRRHFNIK